MEGDIIFRKYKLLTAIGCGSFGDIYLASIVEKKKRTKQQLELNYKEKQENVVVKREKMERKNLHLKHEYQCMKHLTNCPGVPKILEYGHEFSFNFLVMELKGPNLHDLFKLTDRHFGTPTIAHIMLQMLETFKYIHNKGLLHRDLKPENLVTGVWPKDARKVYLIDFGLSKQFIVKDDNGHKCHIHKKHTTGIPRTSLTGTARYASINAHYGDQSRRCDLASFGHVMLYFLRGGNLPWMGINCKTKAEKYLKILEVKEETPLRKLCRGFSREYRLYMEYVNGLGFEDKPNYDYLIFLLRGLLARKGLSQNDTLAWEIPDLMEQSWPPTENS